METIINNVDIVKLDELINKRAAEGRELVTHSARVDNVATQVNIIATFRRPKQVM